MSSMGNHFHHAQPFFHGGGTAHILHPNGILGISRSRTPNPASSQPANHLPEAEQSAEDDPRSTLFNDLFARAEVRIDALFSDNGLDPEIDAVDHEADGAQDDEKVGDTRVEETRVPRKKAARAIEEDDYDDSEEDEDNVTNASPLKAKSTGSAGIPHVKSPIKVSAFASSPAPVNGQGSASQWQAKSSDDVRKKLEIEKRLAGEAAKKSFQTLFYPLENDRDTMVEQQRLDESDRQVDVEMSGQAHPNTNHNTEGTLGQANLGASSLVFRHLIARIDAKRAQVRASDQELRNLMIEVKKNRSKWASEDKIGQEELYEAAEKVLSEIKANTEHSQPFLQRVNKRDAPDYYQIIKQPMDLSTMTKKLKQLQYKSKQEFVNDLNLIWDNCARYNDNMDHFIRKHGEAMRKASNQLVPLIPDIIIRDRAEYEAEERRLHAAEGDIEGAEDSDDEPIISSRGRKAPGKKAKKGSNARKAPAGGLEGTPGVEVKPMVNGSTPTIRHEFLRADSDTAMDGSQNGLNTPPPGTFTPAGVNGATSSSQADPMEIDGFSSVNGQGQVAVPQQDYDNADDKVWKQFTKKGRALATAERHRLFRADKLNPDEPALLRSKAGMRRWTRNQREVGEEGILGKRKRDHADEPDGEPSGATLAEGLDDTEERVLPDYYDTMSAIPDLEKRLQWKEDSEGSVIPSSEETLRVVPRGLFITPESAFSKKVAGNIRQMQETRKVCTKIGIVKQMQLQSQMYQNQFQKYESEPFTDHNIDPHVVSDDGPVMSEYVCRAAMQRSVAKLFYNAGFEEYQPSALDAVTDIASAYLKKLAQTLNDYMTKPKVPVVETIPGTNETVTNWRSKYTQEECILQSLNESGLDLESLESYVKEDADRLNSKLGTLHERMKAHLAELLRPALAADAGPDGVNAFNDGSDQFVGGDFAEDLDEDFFGFKELGLDKEFGLASLSVPLHLLQNRMHSAYQAQNTSTISSVAVAFESLPPLPPVTLDSLSNEIGLIHNFFQAKLHANNDQALVEDEDLPQKQRLPKPRLPPTGKITSPRKKPVREAGPGKGHPKKKMRLVEGKGWVKESELLEIEKGGGKEGKDKGGAKAGSKLKNSMSAMERSESRDADGDFDDDMGGGGGGEEKMGKGKERVNGTLGEAGMMSPESLEAT